MGPLVSIIVPVYNIEKYLDRCIDSLVKQTHRNIEILLMNDASTDRSLDICTKWSKTDPRVKIFSFEHNMGVSAARNTGISKAAAPYLMFVDSDDYLSETAVEELLCRLQNDESDLAIGKRIHTFEDNSMLIDQRYWLVDSVLSPKELFAADGSEQGQRGAHEVWGKLYKRELFSGLQFPPLKYGEDLWLYPSIISKCAKISIVDSPVYYYFHRSSSVTKAPSQQALLDQLQANLFYTQFLLRNKYIEGAKNFWANSIDCALAIVDHARKAELYDRFLSHDEKKILLKNASFKNRLKHLAIQHPLAGRIVSHIKKVMKR